MSTTQIVSSPNRARVWYLVAYLYSFICMGSAVALTGPTLLELGRQSHATLKELPFIYSCRSVGVFAGTFLGGYMVDRFKLSGNTILASFVALLCILTAVLPSIPMLYVLGVVCFVQGTFIGCVDNIAQILLINVYTSEVAPYMQALHCAFGVGAFLAPIIASPFLDKTNSKSLDVPTSGDYAWAYYILAGSMVPCMTMLYALALRDEWKVGRGAQFTPLQDESGIELVTDGQQSALQLEVNKYDQPVTQPTNSSSTLDSMTEVATPTSQDDVAAAFRIKVVVLVGCFLFLYVGCESGYGNYLTAYTTQQLSMDEHTSSLLTSVFWAAFTGGRLLAVLLSIYLSTAVMIGVDLVGCIVSLLLIMMFSHNTQVLWVCSACYGLAVASVYPSAINHAEHTVSLSGRHLSFLTGFATAGEALIPLIIGETLSIAPVLMMIIMFASAVLATVVIAYVLRLKPLPTAAVTKSLGTPNGNTTEMTKLNTATDSEDFDSMMAL